MKFSSLASGLFSAVLLISGTSVMAQEMTLEEATAEVERLEQENIELKEKLEQNEMSIAEYKQQMASIEEQIAQLQAELE